MQLARGVGAITRIAIGEKEFSRRAVIQGLMRAHRNNDLDRIVAFNSVDYDHLLIFENP